MHVNVSIPTYPATTFIKVSDHKSLKMIAVMNLATSPPYLHKMFTMTKAICCQYLLQVRMQDYPH